MKHFLPKAALLTAAALLFSLALPAAAQEETFTIATLQDFTRFSSQCTRDTWSQGITVELTADLDLRGLSFEPVPIFQGTFHGNGHTISGLSFEGQGSRVGLFRTLTATAVVEDLTVEGTLAPQGSASQVGLLAGENDGTIRRCRAEGSVAGQEDVGGLVGFNGEEGSLTDCFNAAAVTGVTNVGGIAGQNLGTVENCVNGASLNTQEDQDIPTSVGGIAGLSRGTIRGCTNTGGVGYQHVGYNMGGIAGLQSGEITGCTNSGAVKGRKDVGGIVGQFEPDTHLTYGPSPSQEVAQSLSSLLGQLEQFTDQFNEMVNQGIGDAQAIHDSLSTIQDRTYSAGTQVRKDFQSAARSLSRQTDAIADDLAQLRESLRQFAGEMEDWLAQAADQAEDLLDRLEELTQEGTDDQLAEALAPLKDTLSQIRDQLAVLSSHRQAMEQELDALEDYLDQAAQLIADDRLEEALQLPFPSLDLTGHLEAVSGALKEIARLSVQLEDQWNSLDDQVLQALGETGQEISQALAALREALAQLEEAGNRFVSAVREDLERVSQRAGQIRKLLWGYADDLGDRAQDAMDDIYRELSAIGEQVDGMTQAAQEDNDALYATSKAILDQMEAVRQAIAGLGREPELTVTDLAEGAQEGPGLVGDCTVRATVEGDSNVGGIVGTVSTEVGGDPEDTFSLDSLELMSDVYATLRAVVQDCRFDGTVTARNDCGGGVAGRCEAGAILDCAARGKVETGSNYCGGIAGRTQGKVVRCAALTDLTGQSWLGGIAGLGTDIADCRAMVQADSDGEYQGAIAGEADGTLSGNRYLMEELAGLDGVDYEERAQGLDFAAFSQLEGIPADFLTFSYRFVADGETVAEIPFQYGEDLDLSQVPPIPQKDGQYGQWPSFPTQNLRRSLVLQAQFAAPSATLADQDGVSQLLVEGSFSPEASFAVHRGDLPSQEVEGYTVLSAWSYEVTGSQTDTVTLRLRAEGARNPAAALYQDGGWQLVDCRLDGSYLVFSAPVQGQVLLLEKPAATTELALLAAVGVLAVILALWFIHRRRKTPSLPAAGAGEG